MNRIRCLAVALASTAALAACKPKAEGPEPNANSGDLSPAEDRPVADAAPTLALLDACKIKMTQPEPHEWATKWDPAHTRTDGQNPSGVRSIHWADQREQKAANDSNTAIPLDIVCGSDDRAKPTIRFDITAFDSRAADVPLAPGSYRIASKASPARNQPGEFIVGVLLFDEGMFKATSGTLKIERFDMNGVAGSFVIDGNEILMGSRPLHLEGSFDLPCRKGLLQSACQSDKAQ